MSTKIEWTDETWNPIRARNRETGGVGHFCVHVSPGCAGCYAERLQARFGNPVRYAAQDAEKVELFLDEDVLMQPLRWRKPRQVFVCSMTDLFLEAVPDAWIDKVFAVMGLAPQHTFQVLTKRAERMKEFMTLRVQGPWAGRAHTVDDDGTERDMTDVRFRLLSTTIDLFPRCPPAALNRAIKWQDEHYPEGAGFIRKWPLPGIWLGVSIEGPAYWARAEHLKQTPAAVRFLSIEPLIEGLGTHVRIVDDMDWVIVGGESGPKARPMEPEWAREIRDQCRRASVPFFMKQMAKKASIPNELMIREWPTNV